MRFNPKVNAISNDYYTIASIPQTWRAAVKRAGFRHRKAYQSRHTFACLSLSAGANPNDVTAQMGHSDAQMVCRV
ncbi:tyrosine-type recombinase/integrase [Pantoea sp. Bo_7]|nr:tyrosine-type recombinase/integrase [Pantoea sp. Bo_7]KAA6095924.1 tyrosine-type recombinase/integrase [Pantoea sp. Bo_10]